MALPSYRFPSLGHLLAIALLLALMSPGCSQPIELLSEPLAVVREPGQGPADTFVFTPDPPPMYTFTGGLRVATVNAEFMFDGYGDEGQASFPHQGDPVKARAHRDRVGEIVRMIDADIVMMAEVEDGSVMQRLVDESLADAGYTVYFVQGTDRFTGQDVGLLSRVPVEKIGRLDERVNVGASTDTYGVSKNMYARLTLGTVPTTIVGLHFLARPDDASRKDRREAQAEVIRRFVAKEIDAGRAVVVLGDFNDFDDVSIDVGGNRPITDVLARIKSAGPGDEDDLHNMLAEVPQAQRFTSHYDRNDNGEIDAGEFSAIDHILLSPELYSCVREVFYVHAHDPTTYTDHFPIVVNLDVR